MDLDSERLRSFRAVARAGGFSRAAKRLHKTQPAVSQSVRALEDDIGEPLFHRLGRGIRLTRAGQILLEHVEQSFAALDAARTRLQALGNLEAGELVIGTSDTHACYLLPPVLAAYRSAYPGIELRISNRPSPETERQVEAREVDVGVVTFPVASSRLVAEPLRSREDVAIFAPGHRLASRSRVRFADLVGEPLLLLDRGSRTRSLIDTQLAAAGGEPRVAMELASLEVVKRLVALGFGVSVVPRIAAQVELEAGSLASARIAGRSGPQAVGIVYPRGAALSQAGARFVEMARELL